MIAAAFAGILIAVIGCIAVEKKREDGVLSYPLWRCNMFTLWGAVFAIALVLVSGVALPRFVGLTLHGLPVQASVSSIAGSHRCEVTFIYTIKSVSYSGEDRRCGLVPGASVAAYYDANEQASATLYLPPEALKDQIAATVLICLGLSVLIVLWLRLTWIVGSPLQEGKKP